MPGRVQVVGLKELRAALRELEGDDTWKSELRQAGMAAAKVAADEAQRTARGGATTLSGTQATMGAVAIATIRALAAQTKATLAFGKASLAYGGGWEFGSGGSHRQFPAKRADGYNLYPAIKTRRAEIVKTYSDAIKTLTDKRFPD